MNLLPIPPGISISVDPSAPRAPLVYSISKSADHTLVGPWLRSIAPNECLPVRFHDLCTGETIDISTRQELQEFADGWEEADRDTESN